MTFRDIVNICCGSRGTSESPDADRQRELSASPSVSERPFCVVELRRSLNEQSFGIKSFTMTSPEAATASVVLLEGRTVIVQLTLQGYSTTNSSDTVNEVEYETLESLLQALSPLYMVKRQEAITTALSRLT